MAEASLTPYRRSFRPAIDASFPKFVEQELDKIAVVTNHIIQAINELEARVKALETP
jgi:hypothetical protein